MNKGFTQTGNLIFTVFVIFIALVGSYFFFFDDYKNIIFRKEVVKVGQASRIKFIHPIYQYSLELPYYWIGKYKVIEEGRMTNFWYIDEAGNQELLFTVSSQLTSQPVIAGGKNKILGSSNGFFYLLNIPDWLPLNRSGLSAQMRKEVLLVEDTFTLLDKKQSEIEIIKILTQNLSASSTSNINFLSFEIIATQEKASTTEYYLWFIRRDFSWKNFRLGDWPIVSSPAVVTISKDNNFVSVKEPRAGINFNLDIKKIFPVSIYKSAIFKETTIEHSALLDKMSNHLDEMVQSYFGSEPILN